MKWISVEDALPEQDQRVLVFTPKTNLFIGSPVRIYTMHFRSGRTKQELEQVERPAIGAEDEHGNNQRPYCWSCENSGSFFGQEVSHWMPLPNPPCT
jgi:hypothetical protein